MPVSGSPSRIWGSRDDVTHLRHGGTRAKVVANLALGRYIRSMATQSASKRPSSNGITVKVKHAAGPGRVTTTLGNVTVSGQKPSTEAVNSNIARSTQALERVGKKLTKPGVYLPAKKDVPRYSADEDNPGVFIRRVNGEVTTGKLQNGQFVETK